MQSQPHILYAQDDPDTLEVQLVLRQAGFRVSVTDDSSKVLSLVATDHIDALILDNWMPGITGLELCRGIRSFDQSIPILFCSGAVTEADKKPRFPLALKAILESLLTPKISSRHYVPR